MMCNLLEKIIQNSVNLNIEYRFNTIDFYMFIYLSGNIFSDIHYSNLHKQLDFYDNIVQELNTLPVDERLELIYNLGKTFNIEIKVVNFILNGLITKITI